MSADLPELPFHHVRPAPVPQPVILDAGALEHAAPIAHDNQEVRDAVFADSKDEVASAVFALWGAGVILDGLIEDAAGQHAAGEPEDKEEHEPKE